MRKYRKRQMIKVYRQCCSKEPLIIIESIDRLKNRAEDSILNHCTKSDKEVYDYWYGAGFDDEED